MALTHSSNRPEGVPIRAGGYSGVVILLVDLDNTLLDRASAFDLWAAGFVRALGGSGSEAAWIIDADRDGYEPRESLAGAIKERFGLDTAIADIVDELLFGHVDQMNLDTATANALKNAREHGWKIAVVTNGTTAQQSLKIRTAGLESYVDAVVISESEGVKKPDPEIFRIAAGRLGLELTGGWMVGDHPTADIAGGKAAGLETGWVSRGKIWADSSMIPNLAADTAAEVIEAVVSGVARPC
ncbi:MAG: HAD family hydrolase [Paeniglutamicibacter sp.]